MRPRDDEACIAGIEHLTILFARKHNIFETMDVSCETRVVVGCRRETFCLSKASCISAAIAHHTYPSGTSHLLPCVQLSLIPCQTERVKKKDILRRFVIGNPGYLGIAITRLQISSIHDQSYHSVASKNIDNLPWMAKLTLYSAYDTRYRQNAGNDSQPTSRLR